jgi:hypothetical protein
MKVMKAVTLTLFITICMVSCRATKDKDQLGVQQQVCAAEDKDQLGVQLQVCDKLSKPQLINKLNKLVADNEGSLTEELLIKHIYNDLFTIDELICYLELRAPKYDTSSIFNQYVYLYMGYNDHKKALFHYYHDVCGVKIIYLNSLKLAFPDQKKDDYLIHQKARFLNCILVGWYNSNNKNHNDVNIKNYTESLANKFNNVVTYQEVVMGADRFKEFYQKVKDGKIGLDPEVWKNVKNGVKSYNLE